MKKICVVIIVILLCMTSCAPKTNEDIFYSTQKKLNSMDMYSCEVTIIAKGNKKANTYEARQWFKKPNTYKIQMIKPDNLKGKVTIHDGEKTYMYHPVINETWMKQGSSRDKKLFLGYFLDICLNSENVIIGADNKGDKEYVVLDVHIPGNHPYYSKERLWIDKENLKPSYLELFDNNGNRRIYIKYHKFVYDPKLSDDFFKIKSK